MLVSRSGPEQDPSGAVVGHASVVGWLMQCKWLDVKGGRAKHQMLD